MVFEQLYNFLNVVVGVNTESLDLVFGLMGCRREVACDILYYYTGYDDFNEFIADMGMEGEEEK